MSKISIYILLIKNINKTFLFSSNSMFYKCFFANLFFQSTFLFCTKKENDLLTTSSNTTNLNENNFKKLPVERIKSLNYDSEIDFFFSAENFDKFYQEFRQFLFDYKTSLYFDPNMPIKTISSSHESENKHFESKLEISHLNEPDIFDTEENLHIFEENQLIPLSYSDVNEYFSNIFSDNSISNNPLECFQDQSSFCSQKINHSKSLQEHQNILNSLPENSKSLERLEIVNSSACSQIKEQNLEMIQNYDSKIIQVRTQMPTNSTSVSKILNQKDNFNKVKYSEFGSKIFSESDERKIDSKNELKRKKCIDNNDFKRKRSCEYYEVNKIETSIEEKKQLLTPFPESISSEIIPNKFLEAQLQLDVYKSTNYSQENKIKKYLFVTKNEKMQKNQFGEESGLKRPQISLEELHSQNKYPTTFLNKNNAMLDNYGNKNNDKNLQNTLSSINNDVTICSVNTETFKVDDLYCSKINKSPFQSYSTVKSNIEPDNSVSNPRNSQIEVFDGKMQMYSKNLLNISTQENQEINMANPNICEKISKNELLQKKMEIISLNCDAENKKKHFIDNEANIQILERLNKKGNELKVINSEENQEQPLYNIFSSQFQDINVSDLSKSISVRDKFIQKIKENLLEIKNVNYINLDNYSDFRIEYKFTDDIYALNLHSFELLPILDPITSIEDLILFLDFQNRIFMINSKSYYTKWIQVFLKFIEWIAENDNEPDYNQTINELELESFLSDANIFMKSREMALRKVIDSKGELIFKHQNSPSSLKDFFDFQENFCDSKIKRKNFPHFFLKIFLLYRKQKGENVSKLVNNYLFEKQTQIRKLSSNFIKKNEVSEFFLEEKLKNLILHIFTLMKKIFIKTRRISKETYKYENQDLPIFCYHHILFVQYNLFDVFIKRSFSEKSKKSILTFLMTNLIKNFLSCEEQVIQNKYPSEYKNIGLKVEKIFQQILNKAKNSYNTANPILFRRTPERLKAYLKLFYLAAEILGFHESLNQTHDINDFSSQTQFVINLLIVHEHYQILDLFKFKSFDDKYILKVFKSLCVF